MGEGCRLGGCGLAWELCRAVSSSALPWTVSLVGVALKIKDRLEPSPTQELELQGTSSWVAVDTRRKASCLQHPNGEEQGGSKPVRSGRFSLCLLALACDVLHLEMRKTTPGRPAMEQGCWGTGCSAWPRRRDGTEADPNSFPCHLPLSLCRRWGAGIGKGALSSGELVMLLGL